jgi:hypothetical protein
VSAAWADAPASAEGTLVFDSGGTWRLERDHDELVFAFRAGGDETPYKTARFDSNFTAGTVRLVRDRFPGEAPVYPLQYPLDELVMIHRLAQGRGLQVHGCGIADRAGHVYVFPGQSGAGKSTLARLWEAVPDVTLLSDERVIIRTDGSDVQAFGTPWHGDAMRSSPRSGTLAGIFFLNHRPTHAVTAIAAPLAAAKLLACAFLPFHSAEAVDRTAAAAERVARAVRCYDLGFAPDPSVVSAIKPHMV